MNSEERNEDFQVLRRTWLQEDLDGFTEARLGRRPRHLEEYSEVITPFLRSYEYSLVSYRITNAPGLSTSNSWLPRHAHASEWVYDVATTRTVNGSSSERKDIIASEEKLPIIQPGGPERSATARVVRLPTAK